MTKATVKNQEAPQAPPQEPLEEGKVALVVEGKQIVFGRDQMELPGMPDISRLRRLANEFLFTVDAMEKARETQDRVRQDIMLELRNEGRTGFALRENGVTYSFEITATQEKLDVKKKR